MEMSRKTLWLELIEVLADDHVVQRLVSHLRTHLVSTFERMFTNHLSTFTSMLTDMVESFGQQTGEWIIWKYRTT